MGQNSPHSYAQPRANYLDTEEWITAGGAPCNRAIFSSQRPGRGGRPIDDFTQTRHRTSCLPGIHSGEPE
jgi:hypothetical protein